MAAALLRKHLAAEGNDAHVTSAGFLDDLPDPPGTSGPPDPAGEPDSGSLGIGSLKRSNQS